MALNYGKSTPNDVLAKARRDLDRLRSAERAEDAEKMSDALGDLAVGLTSLKDWLKNHPGAAFTATDVENYWASSTALSSLRDVANSDKHRIITRYSPSTTDALTSAPSAPLTILEAIAKKVGHGQKYPRLKIIRIDGSRHRAVNLGVAAITECEAFMAKYAVH